MTKASGGHLSPPPFVLPATTGSSLVTYLLSATRKGRIGSVRPEPLRGGPPPFFMPPGHEHEPVLLSLVGRYLRIRPEGTYVDATAGEGGHAAMIASRLSATGTLVCVDRDAEVLAIAQQRLKPYRCRQVFIHDDFRRLPRRLADVGVAGADGVLMDLGISSYHLSRAERGFSFRHEGPLDMRLDRRGETAARLVNRCSEQALADMFRRYGEEPRARAIAGAIVAQRARAPIRTTTELASIVVRCVGSRRRHPATRVFQALRIAVNRELDDLDKAVQAAARLLKEAGRLVVITFHSLEDRLVKQALAALQREGEVVILTRRPLTPDRQEVARNPRARSAKLRAAERAVPSGRSLRGSGRGARGAGETLWSRRSHELQRTSG